MHFQPIKLRKKSMFGLTNRLDPVNHSSIGSTEWVKMKIKIKMMSCAWTTSYLQDQQIHNTTT